LSKKIYYSIIYILTTMPRKKKRKKIDIKSSETKIFFGLLFFVLGAALILTPFVKDEAIIFVYTSTLFGWPSAVWGIAVSAVSMNLLTQGKSFSKKIQIFGFFLLAVSLNILLTFWLPIEALDEETVLQGAGGTLGKTLHIAINNTVGDILQLIIIILLLIVAFSFITSIEIKQITELIIEMFQKIKIGDLKGRFENTLTNDNVLINGINENDNERTEDFEEENEIKVKDSQNGEENILPTPVEKEPFVQGPTSEKSDNSTDGLSPKKPIYTSWKYPSIDMLQEPKKTEQNKEVYKNEARVIESVLRSFNIPAKVVEITIGPTVVRYALSIPAGIAVNKVKRQSNDIEVALRVTKGMMRIEAPIPGTSYIGIEIPNKSPNYVYMKEMAKKLISEADRYELPLILGRDIAGKPEIRDLANMPHLLVAGMTRAGKSIGINSILGGLLLTKTPDELRFILVDPKIVEMEVYNGIPHLLTPVVNDMELVVNALQWSITEMMKRYRQLKQVLARNIVEYNKKIGHTAMPYLIIVIDEMADLMLVAGPEVESKIQRLAQMGRAVGIHLILATQKPVVTVITGLIKSNISGRIAYAVPSAMDSRVILDQTGAENLLGNGDMLYKDQSMSKPIRIQGCFISTEDTMDIMGQIKEQTIEKSQQEKIDLTETEIPKKGKNGKVTEKEEEFPQALEVIIAEGKASASLLQRRLSIGYNKAARLMEQLEEVGAIGKQDGVKPREVLISSSSQILESQEEDIP
jgi:DNA segregation ATPase FtsK/SpoIIIE, S-DNA-T family